MLVTSVVMVIGSFIMMLSLNVKLALIFFALLPILFFTFSKVISKARDFFSKNQKARDALNAAIDENIKAAMLVRVFVTESIERAKFAEKNEYAREVQKTLLKYLVA